jgi:hypothetical protein
MHQGHISHFVRDTVVVGLAFILIFAIGAALESGIAAAIGLGGAVLIALLAVPLIVIYYDAQEELSHGRGRRS